MVRKIQGGGGPKDVSGTSSVKGVDETKATEVGKVSGAKSQSGIDKVRGQRHAITSETREQLFQLIHEEADKMFGPDGLPETKRKKVEGAVKMAIDASIAEEKPSDGSKTPTKR